jgi:hypothetical protein
MAIRQAGVVVEFHGNKVVFELGKFSGGYHGCLLLLATLLFASRG